MLKDVTRNALEKHYKNREYFIKNSLRKIWTKPVFRYIASKFIYSLEKPYVVDVSEDNSVIMKQEIVIGCRPKFLSKLFLSI